MTLSSAIGICFCLCGQVVKAMALHARGHRFDSDHGYWFLDGYKTQGSLGRSEVQPKVPTETRFCLSEAGADLVRYNFCSVSRIFRLSETRNTPHCTFQ